MTINELNADLVRELTGRKVKNLRLAARLGQGQVSEGAKITRPHLSGIENGRNALTAFSCMALCLFYNVTPSELYPTIAELELGYVTPALSKAGQDRKAKLEAKIDRTKRLIENIK